MFDASADVLALQDAECSGRKLSSSVSDVVLEPSSGAVRIVLDTPVLADTIYTAYGECTWPTLYSQHYIPH